jgi:hypothetical protein
MNNSARWLAVLPGAIASSAGCAPASAQAGHGGPRDGPSRRGAADRAPGGFWVAWASASGSVPAPHPAMRNMWRSGSRAPTTTKHEMPPAPRRAVAPRRPRIPSSTRATAKAPRNPRRIGRTATAGPSPDHARRPMPTSAIARRGPAWRVGGGTRFGRDWPARASNAPRPCARPRRKWWGRWPPAHAASPCTAGYIRMRPPTGPASVQRKPAPALAQLRWRSCPGVPQRALRPSPPCAGGAPPCSHSPAAAAPVIGPQAAERRRTDGAPGQAP